MTLQQQDICVRIAADFIALGLAPLLAMLFRAVWPTRSKRWRFPVIIAVFVAWVAQNLFRIKVELPLLLQMAEQRGDIDYDGVGGNVGVLFVGWLPPLIACLILVGIWRLIARFKPSPCERPSGKRS